MPDEKAELVKKIFSDFSKGKTQVEIRLEYKKLGFPISKSQFSRILSNPAYIGKVLARDKKNEKGYYINGIHKPIISLPLFEKIQLLLDANKKKRNMPKVQTIKEELYLRSHLFCPNCGNNLTGSGSKSRSGLKHYYYHCNHCAKARFRADGAHERILAILNEIRFSRNSTELCNLMVKKILQDNTTKKKRRSEETISQEILIYQNRITNLQDDYADRKISLEDCQTSIDRYRQKIQALQPETRENKTTQSRYSEFLKSGINLITNLKRFYLLANVTSRIRIPGSIFSEKLIF